MKCIYEILNLINLIFFESKQLNFVSAVTFLTWLCSVLF